MATYPVKILKDEEGNPFVPLVHIDAVQNLDGNQLMGELDKKVEVSNLKAGTQIELVVDGNNVTINSSAEGTKLINNLTTTTSGIGPLDAAQGKVLKDSIPEVVNNLTTVDSKKALSAHQGYILAGRSVPVGGATGQVLKKSADDDYSLEWGDAADPNAIVGDGSIMKIIELTYNEYLELEKNNALAEDTEYHISDWNENERTYLTSDDIQEMIDNSINAKPAIKESTSWHDTHFYTTFSNDLVLVYGYQDITITTAENPAAGVYYADDIIIELPCYFNDLNYVPMATMRADGALVWIYATQVVDTDHISVSIASPSPRAGITARVHYHCMGTRRKN